MDGGKMCLLVKLLTSKYYNQEAFKATMWLVWRLVKPLRFHDTGEGLMMAEFELNSYKIRVIRDGTWSFDKNIILVKEFEGSK